MNIDELVLRIFDQVRPLLPYMLTVIVVTVAAMPFLAILSKNLWVDSERFRWMGMFFGLKRIDSVRLACAWIKIVLLLTFLIGFKPMDVVHYLLFAVPAVLYAMSTRELARIPTRLMWAILEFAALMCCNLICSYIIDMSAGMGFTVVYVLMSLLTALFGGYLFLTELNDISAGRSTDIDHEWEADTDVGDGGQN